MRRAAALLASTALLATCGQPVPAGEDDRHDLAPAERAADHRARDAALDAGAAPFPQDAAEALAALGYAEFSERRDAPDAAREGVVLHDPARSTAGATIVAVLPEPFALLIDAEGRLLHRWTAPDALTVARCEPLPGGDVLLLGTCGDPKAAERYLLRLAPDGTVRWRRAERVHHDVTLTVNGQVLTITTEARSVPGFDGGRPVLDNRLSLHDAATGEPLGGLSLFDALRSGPRAPPLMHDVMVDAPGDGRDWLHANSAQWMAFPELSAQGPLYAPDNVLVSLRHQDLIAIVDFATGGLVWAWGRGQLRRQHEAHWLPDGNILLFDNGDELRGFSRVLVVDPRSERVVREWTAPRREDFYSRGRGTTQHLPGGNVLVANSNDGEVFEITPEGDVVWRWLCPVRNAEGQRAAVRARRVDEAFVAALRAAR